MLRFLDPTHGQAATIPTDRVIPLRLFDDLPHGKDTIFWTPFLFNDVLDPSKLRAGLEALATFEGWDKIGARLRYNVSYLTLAQFYICLAAHGSALLHTLLGSELTKERHDRETAGCIIISQQASQRIVQR